LHLVIDDNTKGLKAAVQGLSADEALGNSGKGFWRQRRRAPGNRCAFNACPVLGS
jgi:hypothetical protein